jgi:hypothetical protein
MTRNLSSPIFGNSGRRTNVVPAESVCGIGPGVRAYLQPAGEECKGT